MAMALSLSLALWSEGTGCSWFLVSGARQDHAGGVEEGFFGGGKNAEQDEADSKSGSADIETLVGDVGQRIKVDESARRGCCHHGQGGGAADFDQLAAGAEVIEQETGGNNTEHEN